MYKDTSSAEDLKPPSVENERPNTAISTKKTTGRSKSIDSCKATDIKGTNKLGMWNYWLKWNVTDTKKRHLGFPTHINFDDYQHLDCDDKLSRGQNKIKSMGKRESKISTSRKCVGIIPTIQRFLLDMFVGRTEQCHERLKNHINECVNMYATYILVYEVRNRDYYASNSNKTRNKDHESAQIVTVMICEMHVHVARQHHH